MALNMTLDSLEGLDEGIAKLYVEKDGKYHLDVDGHEKNEQGIPRARLNAEIEKRKATESALEDIAQGFVEAIPEDMRDLIPDLPPAARIKWIQTATGKGLFTKQAPDGVDTKRPTTQKPENYEGLSPQTMMAKGYKTK